MPPMHFTLLCCQLFLLSGLALLLPGVESSPPPTRSLRHPLASHRRKLEDYYTNYYFGSHDDAIYYDDQGYGSAQDDDAQADDLSQGSDDAAQGDGTAQVETSQWDNQNANYMDTSYDGRSSIKTSFLDTTPRNWGVKDWAIVIGFLLLSTALVTFLRKMPVLCKTAEQKLYGSSKLSPNTHEEKPEDTDTGFPGYTAM